MTLRTTYIYTKTYLILFFAVMHSVNAQFALLDLDLDKQHEDWYDKAVRVSSHPLYEGSFYDLKNKSNIGHQFYEESYWTQGEIEFRNEVYQNIYMLYDLTEDVLVIRNPNLIDGGTDFLRINQNNVTRFKLHQSEFRRYDGNQSPPIGPGFYEVIHDDQLGMIVKRKKIEVLKSLQFDYNDEDRYYLSYKGEYIVFRNKKSIIQMYPSKKKAIKNFIKTNRLRVKKENKRDIRQLLKFVNKIITEE